MFIKSTRYFNPFRTRQWTMTANNWSQVHFKLSKSHHENSKMLHQFLSFATQFGIVYLYFSMKGIVFQPRVLQLNLENIKLTPAQQIPWQKKSGNVLEQESNPRPSACKTNAQTIIQFTNLRLALIMYHKASDAGSFYHTWKSSEKTLTISAIEKVQLSSKAASQNNNATNTGQKRINYNWYLFKNQVMACRQNYMRNIAIFSQDPCSYLHNWFV